MGIMYERILAMCNQKGIKPGRLCAETGLSRSFMSELKSGRTKELSAKNAQIVADYFGVTVGYLLGEEETKKSPAEPMLNEGEKMLLDLFRQIPEDRQQVVIAMIKAALDRG